MFHEGQTVSIKGMRSANNGRRRASGQIIHIKADGKSAVVRAHVMDIGMTDVHVHFCDLVA